MYAPLIVLIRALTQPPSAKKEGGEISDYVLHNVVCSSSHLIIFFAFLSLLFPYPFSLPRPPFPYSFNPEFIYPRSRSSAI